MRRSKRVLLCGAAVASVAGAAQFTTVGSSATAPSATAPATVPASGPAATQPDGPEAVKLTLRPSAATRPALAHRLLPGAADQEPGDAVPLYLLARRYWPGQKEMDDLLSPENGRFSYLETPPGQFPAKHADRLFAGFGNTLDLFDRAARRRDARWDTFLEEQHRESNNLVLGRTFGYLGDIHHAVNVLGFRARYRAAKGDFAGAEDSLRTSFAVVRHLGAEPTSTPHAQVRGVYARIALYAVSDGWVGQPGSPNLYWALTNLPQPIVDLPPVVQARQVEDRARLPRIVKAIEGNLPADQWPAVLREMVGLVQEDRPPYQRTAARVDAEVARLTAAVGPRARASLVAAGTPQTQVDAMPVEQAVGTYFCREYAAAADAQWRAFTLPYPQAAAEMERAWRELAPDRPPAADNPLVQGELVRRSGTGQEVGGRAVWQADYRFSRVAVLRYDLEVPNRQLALLRTIEAIRDHASRHGGRPPERLDQLTDLPVPPDPMTGEPFAYWLDGRTAVLEASAPPRRRASVGFRYELTSER